MLPVLTEIVIVVVTSPSLATSSTPVIVTVWAVSQSEVVKVRLDVDSETSVGVGLLRLKTTFPVGFVASTTSKVSVVPVSLTVESPPDSVTV